MSFHPARYAAPPPQCDCGDPDDQVLIHDRAAGDTVCKTCGRVVESHCLDMQPESYDVAHARAGPVSVDDLILGAPLQGRVTSSKYQEPDPHRHIKIGFRHVVNVCASLGINSDHVICIRAKELYKDFVDARREVKMRLTEAQRLPAAAAAVYYGCKLAGIDGTGRTIDEIAAVANIVATECNDMTKAYRLALQSKPYAEDMCRAVRSRDMFWRVFQRLSFPCTASKQKVYRACQDVFTMLEGMALLEGKRQSTVCGAVVFKGCDAVRNTDEALNEALKGISVAEIARACGITPATLENAVKEWDIQVKEQQQEQERA